MDELYVVARRVLLDALDALGTHRDAVVLVGAQAVYLRVGEADIAVAPYTTDGAACASVSPAAPSTDGRGKRCRLLRRRSRAEYCLPVISG